jgi:hypothetical protein
MFGDYTDKALLNLHSLWAQLTELNVSATLNMVGESLALLQSAQDLQRLRVWILSEVVNGHHHFVISHPLVSLNVLGKSGMLFNHITLPCLHDLSVTDIDSEWLQSLFILFLVRLLSPLQSFLFRVLMEVNNIWDDNMIQILQHMPSLHALHLAYSWCEVGGGSFLIWLSSWVLDDGQVSCLIPKLNTISIYVGCQLVTPNYEALMEMIISHCSLAHNTSICR